MSNSLLAGRMRCGQAGCGQRRRASMIVCDYRPGYPPDRTVRAGRRSCHPARPAASRASEAADRRRAGVPGGGAGTAGRSELAGWANYGYCAAHSRWYWGLKLYLICTAEGMPVAWCLADPKIGEREDAAALLDLARDTGALRAGMIVLADKGLAGRELERYAAEEVKVLLVRPGRKDERHRYGNLGGMRQWVESVYDTAKDQLSLERHGGRTIEGVFVRIAQRLLALAACIWHNWSVRTTGLRSLTDYDH